MTEPTRTFRPVTPAKTNPFAGRQQPVRWHNSAPPDDSEREAWDALEDHQRHEADNSEKNETIDLD